MDLKAFYDNDQRLGSEIENLNRVILDQQATLNSLNKLLYFIISNLNLELKDENLDTELIVGDNNDSIDSTVPTFPSKSVKIDLSMNIQQEYTSINDNEEEVDYEPGTEFTEDGLAIPPVD